VRRCLTYSRRYTDKSVTQAYWRVLVRVLHRWSVDMKICNYDECYFFISMTLCSSSVDKVESNEGALYGCSNLMHVFNICVCIHICLYICICICIHTYKYCHTVRYIVLCTRIKVHRYHSIIFSIVVPFDNSQ
jgi:hypothetical protein